MGTAASCTDAALDAALAGGGLVTFNCGGAATIDISAGTGTKTITADTTIDAGGLITISGVKTSASGFVVAVESIFGVAGGGEFRVENLTIANSVAIGNGGSPVARAG